MTPSGSAPSYKYTGSRHCQLGVSNRSESHRSVLHEFATSRRSRTTWSIERSARQRLIASPPCPAPMTTVVVRTEPALVTRSGGSGDFDADVRRVSHDVVDGRALLRLRDDCPDLVRCRIGVDVVRQLDTAEPVTDVAVDPENALHVHLTFERRRHPVQLDLPVLCHRGDARCQAAGETDEHVLDRRRPVVL